MQYAFIRWQEVAVAYGTAIAAFAVLSFLHGQLFRPVTSWQLELLAGVSLVCAVLSALRLHTVHVAAAERFILERQAAELRRQTERNARMALTDHLTGLLNRAGINDLIDRAIALGKRTGATTALLYVDLDGFKQINDICGHDAGDEVLVEAALRIQYLLRTGETAARVGGDEFVIVLPSVRSPDEARGLAERIEEAFWEPFYVNERPFALSASIGLAWSEAGSTRSDLLSAADHAMYAVKRWRKREHAEGGR
jgi:diguanylate cyclase (GGDEF)-like protein